MTTALDGGTIEGTFTMTARADASRLVMRFRSDVYEGEAIGFDGNQVNVGFAQPRLNARSALGVFLTINKVIVGEGLLGGVLNGRWPLFDLAGREARLAYDGVKKLDGRELHRVPVPRETRPGGPLRSSSTSNRTRTGTSRACSLEPSPEPWLHASRRPRRRTSSSRSTNGSRTSRRAADGPCRRHGSALRARPARQRVEVPVQGGVGRCAQSVFHHGLFGDGLAVWIPYAPALSPALFTTGISTRDGYVADR